MFPKQIIFLTWLFKACVPQILLPELWILLLLRETEISIFFSSAAAFHYVVNWALSALRDWWNRCIYTLVQELHREVAADLPAGKCQFWVWRAVGGYVLDRRVLWLESRALPASSSRWQQKSSLEAAVGPAHTSWVLATSLPRTGAVTGPWLVPTLCSCCKKMLRCDCEFHWAQPKCVFVVRAKLWANQSTKIDVIFK